jgi:hypothetical protein
LPRAPAWPNNPAAMKYLFFFALALLGITTLTAAWVKKG